MAESKTKNIERNRAPRVQISYDLETYNSPTGIELPFVMGVMAPLAGVSETAEAMKPPAERAFVDVDAVRFPDFMKALAPRVKARVKSTLPPDPGAAPGGDADELAVDLSFTAMGDFAPDRMAEQIPQLAELLRMRRQLTELRGYMDGRADAEKRIAQLLKNEPLLGRIAASAVADGKEG